MTPKRAPNGAGLTRTRKLSAVFLPEEVAEIARLAKQAGMAQRVFLLEAARAFSPPPAAPHEAPQ